MGAAFFDSGFRDGGVCGRKTGGYHGSGFALEFGGFGRTEGGHQGAVIILQELVEGNGRG